MHTHHKVVRKVQEHLFAMGLGAFHDVPVQQRGTGRKLPLGAGNSQPGPAKNVLKLAGQAMDRMTFRHSIHRPPGAACR